MIGTGFSLLTLLLLLPLGGMAYGHLRFKRRQDGLPSDEEGSGGAPAGADPGTIGWNRPTGSTIKCVDTNDVYDFDGTNWDQRLDVNSTFSDAADQHDMTTETVTEPDADSATAVHAGVAASAANAFPGPFTNPDVPRRIQFVFGAGWDGGDVTPIGTDIRDAAATEVITNPGAGGGTVVSTKAYKTVASTSKATIGASGATCSIGSWHGFGLQNIPAKPGVLAIKATAGATEATTEAATWDTTNGVVTPTTVPDATKCFVAEFPKVGSTSTVTATP